MKIKSNIKVTAPATISNLGPGLNSLALAIENLKDEVVITTSDTPGITITEIINNKTNLPLNNSENILGISASLTLDYIKEKFDISPDVGFKLKLKKKIAIGCGLGSSAASAVLGANVINEVFSCPLEKKDLYPFIKIAEQYAESKSRGNAIAASLHGGLMLTHPEGLIHPLRLPVQKGFHIVVFYNTSQPILAKNGANLSLLQQSLEDQSLLTAQMGSLVHAFYTGNIDLITASIKNQPMQMHWEKEFPLYAELTSIASNFNALGAGVSGHGGSFYALCKNSFDAENIHSAFEKIADQSRYMKCLYSPICTEGSIKE